MWEHAKDFIAVPGAIKASLEVLKLIREGRGSTKQDTEAVSSRLGEVQVALRNFARDALELEAIKCVHTLTNDIPTDLQHTFRMERRNTVEASEIYKAERARMDDE